MVHIYQFFFEAAIYPKKEFILHAVKKIHRMIDLYEYLYIIKLGNVTGFHGYLGNRYM